MRSTSKALQQDLEAKIKISKLYLDADVKISVYDITTKAKANVEGDKTGWAASIIKVPIMVEVLRQIEARKLGFNTQIKVDKRFVLEDWNRISKYPQGQGIEVAPLIHFMIVESDNTATNMLADTVGIHNINECMWDLGMKRSMLGHLLCPNVPRYTSAFNKDGSNVTTPNDMTLLFRHIYDDKLTELTPFVKIGSDVFLEKTTGSSLRQRPFLKSSIKAKMGSIYDNKDGGDYHVTGVIDNHLLVTIMMNKIGRHEMTQKRSYRYAATTLLSHDLDIFQEYQSEIQTQYVFEDLMGIVGRHLKRDYIPTKRSI